MRRLVLAALLLPAAALAQPEPERLPDLTPREFEIVGEVQVSLPQIERQPLSGFGPPPRTFVVPAERQAATGAYAPSLDGLGNPALAPPTAPALSLPEGRRGRVEGGLGRYFARYGRLDLALPAGPGLLVADVDVDGLSADEEAGEPFVGFNRFAGRAGWRGRGPLRFSAEAGALRNGYALIAGGLTDADRRATTFDAEARLETDAGAVPFALGVRAGRTRLADEGPLGDPVAATDGRVEGEGRLDLLGGIVRLDAAGGASQLGGTLDGTLTHYAAGGVVGVGRVGGVRLEVGVRALGFDAEETGASSNVVAPIARADIPFGANGRLFARTEGRVVPRGLADVLRENPFVVGAPALAPDVRVVDAAAGLDLRGGPLGLRLAAEAIVAPTYAFFERGAGGLFEASYARARTYALAADATFTTASGIEAAAGLSVRRGRLTEEDELIPYFARLAGRAGLQVPVGERGRVGLSGAFEGPRPADRADTRTLPSWGSLAFDGAYEVAPALAATLRAERLLGRAERWEGFAQAPLTVLIGARYVFD